jgi:pimeloyl-ACP methyl ester carboxylesterase
MRGLITVFVCTMVISSALAEPRYPFRAEVVGRGPAMILIPGLNSSGAVWKPLVDDLKDRYTCHVLTLAGFAGEPAIGAPFLPAIRTGLLRYIEEHQLKQPVLVGHSLGGVVTIWLAATASDHVGRIVTIDGVPFLPGLTDLAATAESMRPIAQRMRDAVVRASDVERARQTTMSLHAMITAPEHVRVAEEWAATSDLETTGQALMEIMTTDLRHEVSRIRVPVLLIAPDAPAGGAGDRVRQLYRLQFAPIPNHQIIFVPNARHFVMLDDRQTVLSAIDTFLN